VQKKNFGKKGGNFKRTRKRKEKGDYSDRARIIPRRDGREQRLSYGRVSKGALIKSKGRKGGKPMKADGTNVFPSWEQKGKRGTSAKSRPSGPWPLGGRPKGGPGGIDRSLNSKGRKTLKTMSIVAKEKGMRERKKKRNSGRGKKGRPL